MRYTIVGAAGYIAERHVKAIKELGGEVVAICDIHDSVGYIDRYFPNCRYFNNYAECLEQVPVDYVVVCTPNNSHLSHINRALSYGCNVICEKPLVTSVEHLDLLAGCQWSNKINTILQLRYHPEAIALKNLVTESADPVDLKIDYIAPRGDWYDKSWKGDANRSGGLLFNIGIHLFEMLYWILGEPIETTVTSMNDKSAAGGMRYAKADVSWRLSTSSNREATKIIKVNDQEYSFANNFENLHLKSHAEILVGRGFGIEDVRPSTLLIEQIYQQAKGDAFSLSSVI